MTDLLRRSRGLAIALAVLAISATVAFAAAPQARVSSPTPLAEEASESPEASESAEPSESPEASESAEPSETPEASESAEPSEAPKAAEAVETASTEEKDTHGALVSTAARMPTPDGFANHGAFVSCVAHLDVSVIGFEWTTVTPEFCGAANPKAAEKAAKAAEKAAEKAAKAAGKSAESKAKGATARAAHGKPSR